MPCPKLTIENFDKVSAFPVVKSPEASKVPIKNIFFENHTKIKSPKTKQVPFPERFNVILPSVSEIYIRLKVCGISFRHSERDYLIKVLKVTRGENHGIIGPNLYVNVIIKDKGYECILHLSWWNFMSLLSASNFDHFNFQKWACRVYKKSLFLTRQIVPVLEPLPEILKREQIFWKGSVTSVKELLRKKILLRSQSEALKE
ncbi:MAG: hypothetical protein CMB64_05015 [Euryarchaeota archaeon]|nr:hypothetical protein [Euryarchaeota archaeon]